MFENVRLVSFYNYCLYQDHRIIWHIKLVRMMNAVCNYRIHCHVRGKPEHSKVCNALIFSSSLSIGWESRAIPACCGNQLTKTSSNLRSN